ncbi:uncharacterized protein Gasu_43150 [Galdieria sulphuraria]|uniref:Uncharacterized protein n=1 Tax=Galdieria sulphuraria TaxID=130081 RepID=M2XDS2_GALSU|nr:uncharacterized protein Gasu_43150 [Galdieria sulphuraria]EME28147.1 hypothetical protein Gasu_43150 [Galdieria sulphuraria]|eukprot:XP_005704667.1 hypothetical protein Gasu_43150 [Galdieria sulphuraria]
MKTCVGFLYCTNKLGTNYVKHTSQYQLGKDTQIGSLGRTTKHNYRRSTRQVLRAVASKESSTHVRKQLADSLNEEALKLVGFLHGHRTLFVAGKGFDTAAATLFRKLDTASACPTVGKNKSITYNRLCFLNDVLQLQELNVNRSSLPGIEAVIPIVTNKQHIIDVLSQNAHIENGQIPREEEEEEDTVVETVLFSLFQKFFRMLVYAIATFSIDYVDENSFILLENLFREMKVEKSVITQRFNILKEQIQQLVPHYLWKECSTVISVLETRLQRMNIA